MIIVSPGIYATEKDLSLYFPQLAQTIFGMVGTASKGVTDEIVNITDEATLISTFGKPSAQHIGLYAAIRYLRKGKQLKFVRVAHYDEIAVGNIRDAGDAGNAVAVSAVSSGSWGNDITLVVSDGTDAGTYKIIVLYNGATAGVYDLLKVGAANVDDDNYISTRINGISEYISVVPDTTYSDLLASVTAVVMADGDDGAPVEVSDFIGSAGSPPTVPTTGLQLFANGEEVDVNVIAIPDSNHRTVISAMITLCETRADCMCLISVPKGKNVQQAVAWSNGLGGGDTDPTSTINSSYAAIFYPWVQVYDGYGDANVWIPLDGHIAGVMAYTDYVADPWWAPAGLRRAILTDVLDLEHSATQGDRDYMYANGNVVNPVINYPGQGIVVWGQRTSSRTSSAVDRINVRRMMMYLRKGVATAARTLVFQPNDEDTWADYRNLIEPICEEIKGRRGLYDYSVVCDSTTNTSAVIARNELRGKVLVKPTKTAEMISIDFIILNNEAIFAEF